MLHGLETFEAVRRRTFAALSSFYVQKLRFVHSVFDFVFARREPEHISEFKC